jgi:hypothetical protein
MLSLAKFNHAAMCYRWSHVDQLVSYLAANDIRIKANGSPLAVLYRQ